MQKTELSSADKNETTKRDDLDQTQIYLKKKGLSHDNHNQFINLKI